MGLHARALLVILLPAALAGCAGESVPQPVAQDAPEDTLADSKPLDPDDPTLLLRPFTAEQIRDEWVAGLTLTWREKTPEGIGFKRWTVVEADAEGAAIESAPLDDAGRPVGDPEVAKSRWTELRDHAAFPVATASRERATRFTPLGRLEGWLYAVRDDESGTLTEFFFAESLPGAPVHVRTTRGGQLVRELMQTERRRPE